MNIELLKKINRFYDSLIKKMIQGGISGELGYIHPEYIYHLLKNKKRYKKKGIFVMELESRVDNNVWSKPKISMEGTLNLMMSTTNGFGNALRIQLNFFTHHEEIMGKIGEIAYKQHLEEIK